MKALSEWEFQALDRGMAYIEQKRMGSSVAVRFHPSKLPFIPGSNQRFFFGMQHFRRSYAAALAGWTGAIVVAGMRLCVLSYSD